MSTTTVIPFARPGPSRHPVAESSIPLSPKWLAILLAWSARRRQRQALAELADDARLLADIGLTREQALGQAVLPVRLRANSITDAGSDR